METPTYYELKSIEKDGLPKEEGWYHVITKYSNAFLSRYFTGEIFTNYDGYPVESYLSPISLPEKRKSRQEIEILAESHIKKIPVEFDEYTHNNVFLGFIGGYEECLDHQFLLPVQEGKSAEKIQKELEESIYYGFDGDKANIPINAIKKAFSLPSSPKQSAETEETLRDILNSNSIKGNGHHREFDELDVENIIMKVVALFSSPSENNSKEEAIRFAEWMNNEGYVITCVVPVKWEKTLNVREEQLTTEQLYELYSQAKLK